MALLGNLTGSSQFFNDPNFYNEIATQSLRFDRGGPKSLTRTPSSASNRKTWTWSGWIKPSIVGQSAPFFTATTNSAVSFNGDTFRMYNWNGSSNDYILETNAFYRDSSAWYHIAVAIDTTQGTASNRIKIYINGEQITSFSTETYPSLNFDGFVNSASAHKIGSFSHTTSYSYDGYMAEVNFVDGLALDPTYFGETKNGVWIPKVYTGSYGTNGFRLQFNQTGTGTASSSTIGADTSGNTNHWTSSGIVASDCAMPDSPENNFATWNSLRKSESASTFSEGNLKAVIPVSSANSICATMGVSSGKYYWEVQRVAERPTLGVGDSTDVASVSGFPTGGNEFGYFADSGNKYPGDSSYGATYANGDIIGFALDMDEGTLVAYKNNSSQGTLATGLTDTIFPFVYNGTASLTVIGNFGQDSSFAGTKTAQGNTDGNGIGDFYYAPPSGFLALCSANLPEPTISPNSATQADDYFNTILYTGNGSPAQHTIGFRPNLVWGKKRNAAQNNWLINDVGDVNKWMSSDGTDAEMSEANGTTFNATSFTTANNDLFVNNGGNYVVWAWKGNGTGTAVSNSDGSVTTTVSANTDAGFSIVLYTGTGANATFGHGLGAVPKMIITKTRSHSGNWMVYHGANTSAPETDFLKLDTTVATEDLNTVFNDTAPTSSVFSLGSNGDVNTSGRTQVAYCFAEIEGYSRFGSYTGNGNADGAFVFTGFRPAWVMTKVTSATNQWQIHDNKRNTSNVVNKFLLANANDAENTGTGVLLDFLSNGFKIRVSGNSINASGASYIYMAFAEAPFKYANAR